MAKKSRYMAYADGVNNLSNKKNVQGAEMPSSVRKRLLMMKEEAKRQNEKSKRKEE